MFPCPVSYQKRAVKPLIHTYFPLKIIVNNTSINVIATIITILDNIWAFPNEFHQNSKNRAINANETSSYFPPLFVDAYWQKIFSPERSSFTLIPNRLQSGIINSASGKPLPHFHLEIVLSLISRISANCRCVIFFSLRQLAVNFPIFIWFTGFSFFRK